MTPPAALVGHRLAMAYALGLSLQIAFELRECPTLPNKADRDAYWRQCTKDQPRLSSDYAPTAVNTMAVTSGLAMASAVREFYAHAKLREKYDHEVINYFRSLPATLIKDPKAMTGSFDVSMQVLKLKMPGVAYAKTKSGELLWHYASSPPYLPSWRKYY